MLLLKERSPKIEASLQSQGETGAGREVLDAHVIGDQDLGLLIDRRLRSHFHLPSVLQSPVRARPRSAARDYTRRNT